MNRRELFVGAAALGAVGVASAAPEPEPIAWMVAQVQCAKCFSVLALNETTIKRLSMLNRDPSVLTTQCERRDCENYGVLVNVRPIPMFAA